MNISESSIKEISRDVSILYVENDILLLTQVNILLNRYFNNIDCADNGEAALILYKRNSYDLIITDLKLPKLNGLEFIKQVKKINGKQDIIVTTSVETPNVLKILINLGVKRFISKPFDFSHFFKIVYKEVTNIHHLKVECFYRDKAQKFAQLYQDVVDNLKFGVILMELKDIILVNKEFLRITGFTSFERLKYTLENISEIFYEKDLKLLDNEEFIDLLIDKEFLEATVVNKNDKSKKKLILEISQLSDLNKFLITFLNVEFLENHITRIKAELLRSDFSGLPNMLSFKSKFDVFKNEKEDLFLVFFSMQNFKSLRLYFGKANVKNIFLEVLKEIASLIRHKKIEKEVFIFDFGINKTLFVVNEKNLKNLNYVFSDLRDKKFYQIVEHHGEKKKVAVNLKFNTFTMPFDKTKSCGELLMDISEKFYELSEETTLFNSAHQSHI